MKLEYLSPPDIYYDSPIDLYVKKVTNAFQTTVEGKIFDTVCDIGVKIDKDKLLQCLNQDKERYTEAYHRGFVAGKDSVIRCKDCKKRNTYHCFKDEQGFLTDDDWFCADAVKKDDDNDD